MVLEWCARENGILLTHDMKTIPGFAYQRVQAGRPMPGVFEVPLSCPMGTVIDDLSLLTECSFEDEWAGQVRYLPL